MSRGLKLPYDVLALIISEFAAPSQPLGVRPRLGDAVLCLVSKCLHLIASKVLYTSIKRQQCTPDPSRSNLQDSASPHATRPLDRALPHAPVQPRHYSRFECELTIILKAVAPSVWRFATSYPSMVPLFTPARMQQYLRKAVQ